MLSVRSYIEQPALASAVTAGPIKENGDVRLLETSSSAMTNAVHVDSSVYDNEAGSSSPALASLYIETQEGPGYLRPVIGASEDTTFKVDDYLGVSHLISTEVNDRGFSQLGIKENIPLVALGSSDLIFSPSKAGTNWTLWSPPGANNNPLVVVIGSSPAWAAPEIPTRLRDNVQPLYDLYKAGYNVAFVSYTDQNYPTPETEFAAAYAEIQQEAAVDPNKTVVFGSFNGAEIAARAALDASLLAGATAQPVATVLYAGVYLWTALLATLPADHFPDGAQLVDVADKDTPSPMWHTIGSPLTARDSHIYIADAVGVLQDPASILGPPWITSTLTREDDPWQGAALFNRLGDLANVTTVHGGVFDAASVGSWIRAEIGL